MRVFACSRRLKGEAEKRDEVSEDEEGGEEGEVEAEVLIEGGAVQGGVGRERPEGCGG